MLEGAGDLKADLDLDIGVCCDSMISLLQAESAVGSVCWEQVKAELYIYIGYFKLFISCSMSHKSYLIGRNSI
mgnify:CR=1 FL=1